MRRPAHLLPVMSLLLGAASAVRADTVDPVTPPEAARPPVMLAGPAMSGFPLAETGFPMLSGISVSHGAAPAGAAEGAMDVDGMPDDVTLGEMASGVALSNISNGPALATPGSSWSGGMDLPRQAEDADTSDAASIPLPSAAGLSGAALAAIIGGRRRRRSAGVGFRTVCA